MRQAAGSLLAALSLTPRKHAHRLLRDGGTGAD
jgi:hypothetical protein